MAGLTISEIREALAAQLRANIDRGFNVKAYPPQPQAPSILILNDSDAVDYWLSFSDAGVSAVRLTLMIDPARGGDVESIARRLDDVLSAGVGNTSSVLDAIMADKSLGLAGVSCDVKSATVDPIALTLEIGVEVTVSKVAP